MRLCTEECRVLGHSDQCWMPPLPPLASPGSSSSDYRSNLYIPGEEASQATDLSQDKTPQPCTDTCSTRNQSFSTFGKDMTGEDGGEEEGGDGDETRDEDLCGTTSLLSEMSSVFQRLLPQGLDSYVQVNENHRGTSLSGVGVPMTGSLDRRRGHLPGKANPSIHQQGVAAWAANTHFQNPGSSIGPSGHHQAGSYHTLKPSTKLSSQNSSSHKGPQAPKNSPQNSSHTHKPHGSPLLAALVSPTLVQAPPAPAPVPPPLPGPSSKWLPAMEEIPENYEEDDFDSVLCHLQGKRSDSRHELVDASELVAEINKLLQDVRQS